MKKIGFWGFLLFILGMTAVTYYFFIGKDGSIAEARGNSYYHRIYPQKRFMPSTSPLASVLSSSLPVPTTPPNPSTTPISSKTPPPTPAAPTAPPVSQAVSFGVVVDDYANKTGAVTSLEQLLGKKIEVLAVYKQFGLDGRDLDPSDLSFAKSTGKKLSIAWEPWNPDQGMVQSKDYLKSIIAGEQDGYIHNFGQAIKSFGNPTEIRFAHEMNGNWYPWGNRSQDYIAAYQHIVTLFRADNVTNVKWMWSINADNVPYSAISNVSNFYPGDGYVDVIGIDGYNWGVSADNGGWKSFNQVFSPAYTYLTKTYHKPISISETASTELGGDKATWINDMFTSLPGSFPAIYELVWFNLLKETDWRINSTQQSQQAFKTDLQTLNP